MAENTPDIARICQSAVALADKHGESFDYTPESITAAERMLAGQNVAYKQGKLTDIYVWNLSVMIGVYIGQTMMHCALSERGYRWRLDSDGVPMLSDGKDNYISPIYQVRKRITGNEDDNVRAFFEAVLDLADGNYKNFIKNRPVS